MTKYSRLFNLEKKSFINGFRRYSFIDEIWIILKILTSTSGKLHASTYLWVPFKIDFFLGILGLQQMWGRWTATHTQPVPYVSQHKAGALVINSGSVLTHDDTWIIGHFFVVHSMSLNKCTVKHIPHHSHKNIFYGLPVNLPFLWTIEATNILCVSLLWLFLECHIVAIIQYAAISHWLTSLSCMCLNFFLVFSWLDNSYDFSPG